MVADFGLWEGDLMDVEEYEEIKYWPMEVGSDVDLGDACEICDAECGESWACDNCQSSQRDDGKDVYFIEVI